MKQRTTTVTDPTASKLALTRTPVPEGRRTMPAGRTLSAILVCLVAWGFLSAPGLKRASEAQPLGTRRTVSLWILKPLAALSDGLQLTRLTDAVQGALGRDPHAAPGGELDIPPAVPGDKPPRDKPLKPVTETRPMRTPTADNELRVVVLGDSLAVGLGVYMERVFRPALVRVSGQGVISTGLARPDYFNWPRALTEIEEIFRPDLVVVMLGNNDNQGLLSPSGDSETSIGTVEWQPAYEERVEEFARIAVDNGSHVVWVGLPIVKDKDRWQLMQRQNDVYERVADATPNAAFVDTWDLFDTRDGDYSAYTWLNGTVELVRATDGIHFNATGYEIVARAVATAAHDEFDLTKRVVSD